jgi:uncharacterized protein (DUF2147 family)
MKIFCFLFSFLFGVGAFAQKNPNAILGKWMSVDGNLLVEVYKDAGDYKAKVLWFDDSDNKNRPMATRTDEKNPDKALRTRRIIGLQVLNGLTYNSSNDRWEDGKIYDSSSGKTWDASAWITSDNFLKLRGYWLLELFGETMKFKRA